MDIKYIFKEVSKQLSSKFELSTQINHQGSKGAHREDNFKIFLQDHLPIKYAVGQGEVVTPENRVSGQLDIIIYDSIHCPTLIKSSSSSVYPIESVYGAISMKSHLDSKELKDGYQNIASLKEILSKQSFTSNPFPGFAIGIASPTPITGIIAYSANRSLEAIATQAKNLDAELPDIALRPDFIAVIGKGIIAPRGKLRGGFNHYKLPDDKNKLVELRKTGEHTLSRIYMHILSELNTLTLRPFDLSHYDNMPKLIGAHRVRDNIFAISPINSKRVDDPESRVTRINEAGIKKIVRDSVPITVKQLHTDYVGQIPLCNENELKQIVYVYNPNKLPPPSPEKILASGIHSQINSPVFIPLQIEIDGKHYFVDVISLSSHFENDNDFTIDELCSM